MEPNLIVTYDPHREQAARKEVESLVDAEFLDSATKGVFLLATKENPKSVVRKLKEMCENEPFRFRYTFRYTPVEQWMDTDMDSISKALKAMNSKIGHDESWKMHIESRNFRISKSDLIKRFTEHIERPKIDLRNPDKTIKIDIIGNRTALSLLEKNEHLSVSNVKD